MFSSDNGYHLGQHRLNRGKQTAFDTDIRVPLIMSGPGVAKAKTSSAVVQNTDLYPTFVDLAGGKPALSRTTAWFRCCTRPPSRCRGAAWPLSSTRA